MIYNVFGSGIYHKPRSIFETKSKDFHNKTLVFLMEMILGWLDISWVCTDTCQWKHFFNILYTLYNSLEFLPITNLKNQLGIFMIIIHGKGGM